MWLRNGLTVLAEALDVKFDCFANERFCFISVLRDGDTPRKIWDISPDAFIRFFEDDKVFHDLQPCFLRPACFRILPSVPTGTSKLGFPATVTVPVLWDAEIGDDCLECERAASRLL